MTRPIRVADLFCGAGGTSTGILQACAELGLQLDLLAINHWPLAIQTHMANHPEARHACAALTAIDLGEGQLFPNVDAIDPRKAVPSGKLDLLIASPECTHHSNARGGRPRSDQSRSTPWCILRWADALHPRGILIENVPEFRTWGPLGVNGKPMKSRKGETFRAFLIAIESLGYHVDHQILNAADFGDATTRRRLFIVATRGRARPAWPSPTHAKDGEGGLKSWRSAREIIDWGLPGKSIFGRKRPLAPKTIDRIAAGLRRFCGDAAEPFLVMLYGTNTARSVDRPLPTVTATGNHIGLVQPFLLPHRTFRNMAVDGIDQPLRTITGCGDFSLVEPFIVNYHGGKRFIRVRSVDKPLPVQDTSNRFGLCEPFLVPQFGERTGQEPRTHSVDNPLPSVTSHGAGALVEPFLTRYNRTGSPQSVEKPLGTATTRDRFALVEPAIVEVDGKRYALDIRFRMLQPHELAAAMSFPKDYQFRGSREQQVKQIGNAVAVCTARALSRALLELWVPKLTSVEKKESAA